MTTFENLISARNSAAAELAAGKGRGYASTAEFWAEARIGAEQMKKQADSIKKIHDEMWEYVRDADDDSAAVLISELGRAAAELAYRCLKICAMADLYQDPESLLAEEDDSDQTD